MDLIHEFTYRAEVAPGIMAGPGPFGNRMIVAVTGGWVRGERLNGTFVAPAGDWILLGPDGFARLDVRAQFQTDDGALIFVRYTGVVEMNDKVMGALGSPDGETAFDDQYFRTTPTLETGDERYAWVNTTVFVARGRMAPGAVEYEVYRLS